MELYKFELNNGHTVYAVGEDVTDARDKVRTWITERFFQSVQISNEELIAEVASRGHVEKLLL